MVGDLMVNPVKLQKVLAKAGFYKGAIDGKLGRQSKKAIQAVIGNGTISRWSFGRVQVAAMQTIFATANLNTGSIDGYWGSMTEKAYEEYMGIPSYRPVEIVHDSPVSSMKWPRRREAAQFFGAPGTNITTIIPPYPMVLAWNTRKKVRKISCNIKTADALSSIFTDVADHYGSAKIIELGLHLFGGCLNVRKIRGGNTWSSHAFGGAWDVDPARNSMRQKRDAYTRTNRRGKTVRYERARLSYPDAERYFEIWEKYGGVSLGRRDNFDWMHCQLMR